MAPPDKVPTDGEEDDADADHPCDQGPVESRAHGHADDADGSEAFANADQDHKACDDHTEGEFVLVVVRLPTVGVHHKHFTYHTIPYSIYVLLYCSKVLLVCASSNLSSCGRMGRRPLLA